MRRKILLFFLLNISFYSFSKEMFISGDNINVRSNSNINSNIIVRLNKNTKVNVIEYEKEWAKISLNKRFGYVNKKFLSEKPLEIIKNKEIPKGFKQGYEKGVGYLTHPLSIIGFYFFIGFFKKIFRDKKDGRFVNGVKEGKLNLFDIILTFILYVLLFLIYGFFSGVYYWLKSLF